MALDRFAQVFLPYCFLWNADDGSWSVFNREYNTLGSTEYGDWRKATRYKLRITELRLAKNTENGRKVFTDGSKAYWLYNDTTSPWTSARNWDRYQKRLRAFSKLKVLPMDLVSQPSEAEKRRASWTNQ